MSRGDGHMATVNEHLSVDELGERYVACRNGTASRHFQAIWLLARGHTVAQVSATTAFGERWIEQLLERYNSEGPDALGDLRRRNGAVATILKPELLAKLRDRLIEPPPDGIPRAARPENDFPAGGNCLFPRPGVSTIGGAFLRSTGRDPFATPGIVAPGKGQAPQIFRAP
jgi:hypothetical protein